MGIEKIGVSPEVKPQYDPEELRITDHPSDMKYCTNEERLFLKK